MKKLKQKLPTIQILATKENDDGSMDIEIEYQDDWVDLVKIDLKKKKVTKQDIEQHFVDLLTKAVRKEGGYNLEIND